MPQVQNPLPNQAQLHTIMHGRVQGVSFRYYTVQQAQQLALTGWVRNRRDGTVESLAIGACDVLEIFLAWLTHGPAGAQVTHIDADWSETPAGEPPFTAFQVRYDSE